MKNIRMALLTTLLLLPAARVWAQPYDAAGPRELYHAEVCNQGQIKVLVAVAYKDFGFTDEFWMIDYWYRVEPGRCKLVFSHFYAPNNLFSFQSFPLHLAFVFTDSTGVTGAAKVRPPRGVAASRFHLCVGGENYKYRVNGKDPQAKCPKGALIPASIDWEPTQGVYPNAYSREYPPPMRFTVALGPNDRAIPVAAWQASSSVTPQGPGVLKDMSAIIKDAVNGPGAPKLNMSARNRSLWLQVCAPLSVVEKASWSDPQSARARALKTALRQFVASHRFRDADAADGPTGSVRRIVRVTEGAADQFSVQGVTDCPGDSYTSLQVAAVDQPLATRPAEPKPAPKKAPEPNPGFGDLIGPGGFITPLPPK
jgi:Protein of unknown function (DUF1036)